MARRVLQLMAVALFAAACTEVDSPTGTDSNSPPRVVRPPSRPNATQAPDRTVSAIQISAWGYHTCALESDNVVACWGEDNDPSGAGVGSFGRYSWISAGLVADCGILVYDGSIYCWRAPDEFKAAIPSGAFTRVAVGGAHACAIRTDKTIACWGENADGQTNSPTGTYDDITSGGYHSCAVGTDDTQACWGKPEYIDVDPGSGPPVTSWGGVWTQIAAGFEFACGIKTSGSLVCAGNNSFGQITDVGQYGPTYYQLAAGFRHTCGVTTAFTLRCWGSNGYGQATPPAGNTFSQAAAGVQHSCAISNGNVFCWGDNTDHQLDVPYEVGPKKNTETTLEITPDAATAYGRSVSLSTETVVPGRDDAPYMGLVDFVEDGTCDAPGRVLEANVHVSFKGKTFASVRDMSPGTHTILGCYRGADGLNASYASGTHEVTAAATTATITLTPTSQQYSDRVSIKVAVTPAPVSGIAPAGTVQISVNGTAVTPAGGSALGADGTVTLSDVQLNLPAGSYPVSASFTSADETRFLSATATSVNVTVTKEDAAIVYAGGNLEALKVSAPGGGLNANALSFAIGVKELEPDVANTPGTTGLGNIANSGLTVTLLPVGPGTSYVLTCTASGTTGTGYAAQRNFNCKNPTSIAVNVYEVEAAVTGNYYTAAGYNDVFTVYDPSLGFATGGGTFLIDGERVRFGLNLKYKKNGSGAKGSIVVVRQHANGTRSELVSNALSSDVALGEDPSVPMGWAAMSGKATYTTWNATTKSYVTVGGQEFVLYVEDRNDPGVGPDRAWVGGPGAIKLPGTPATARANAVPLTGGNVSAPHRGP